MFKKCIMAYKDVFFVRNGSFIVAVATERTITP